MTQYEIPEEDNRDLQPCPNCGWEGREDDLNPIKDIFQRVAPGEVMPAGECPKCGALVHLKGGGS